MRRINQHDNTAFESLPNEIRDMMQGYLSKEEITQLKELNKRWYLYVSTPTFFKSEETRRNSIKKIKAHCERAVSSISILGSTLNSLEKSQDYFNREVNKERASQYCGSLTSWMLYGGSTLSTWILIRGISLFLSWAENFTIQNDKSRLSETLSQSCSQYTSVVGGAEIPIRCDTKHFNVSQLCLDICNQLGSLEMDGNLYLMMSGLGGASLMIMLWRLTTNWNNLPESIKKVINIPLGNNETVISVSNKMTSDIASTKKELEDKCAYLKCQSNIGSIYENMITQGSDDQDWNASYQNELLEIRIDYFPAHKEKKLYFPQNGEMAIERQPLLGDKHEDEVKTSLRCSIM